MTHVAPRIVNNVSFVTRISHEIHFSWQAQYLVSFDYDTCWSGIVNDVSYVTRISHGTHFSWQAQYLVSLDNDTCCSAHCK